VNPGMNLQPTSPGRRAASSPVGPRNEPGGSPGERPVSSGIGRDAGAPLEPCPIRCAPSPVTPSTGQTTRPRRAAVLVSPARSVNGLRR
jgi:hypothetical protein